MLQFINKSEFMKIWEKVSHLYSYTTTSVTFITSVIRDCEWHLGPSDSDLNYKSKCVD